MRPAEQGWKATSCSKFESESKGGWPRLRRRLLSRSRFTSSCDSKGTSDGEDRNGNGDSDEGEAHGGDGHEIPTKLGTTPAASGRNEWQQRIQQHQRRRSRQRRQRAEAPEQCGNPESTRSQRRIAGIKAERSCFIDGDGTRLQRQGTSGKRCGGNFEGGDHAS